MGDVSDSFGEFPFPKKTLVREKLIYPLFTPRTSRIRRYRSVWEGTQREKER